MHRSFKTLLAIAMLTTTFHIAHADQTLTGEIGLPLNPTALSSNLGKVEVGGSYYDFGEDRGNAPVIDLLPPPKRELGIALLPQDNGPLDTYNLHFYGVHAVGRIHKNLELSGGIDRLRVSGDGPFDELTKTGIALGAKYLINSDAASSDVRYAVGVGYSRALLHNIRAYGVASKPFNVREDRAPIVGHLGVRWDRYDLRDIDGDDSSRLSVFAGAEVPITKKGDFSFIGEIASRNNDFNTAKIPFSAGLRYGRPQSSWTVGAGYQRQGLTDDSGFYARVGFGFK